MPKAHSPAVFNGGSDNYYDPNFPIDINQKMKVPKSIRVSGDYSDDDASSINGNWNQPMPAEKFDMNVPDRILVVGKYFSTNIYYLFIEKHLCVFQVKINIWASGLLQLR